MNKIILVLFIAITLLAYQNCGSGANSSGFPLTDQLAAGVSATDTGNGGIITSNYVENLNILIDAICYKNKEDNGEDPNDCELYRFGGDIAYLNALTSNKEFIDHVEYHRAQMQQQLKLQEPQYSNCLQYVNLYELSTFSDQQDFILDLLNEPNCSKVILYTGN